MLLSLLERKSQDMKYNKLQEEKKEEGIHKTENHK